MLDKRKTNFFFSGNGAKIRLEEFAQKGDCLPLDVVVHPTTRCNHSCNFCYHRLNFGEGKHIDYDTTRCLKLLEELQISGVQSLIISGGGEPLMHKNVANII